MKKMTFFEKLKRGLVKPTDIEKYIEECHEKESAGQPLSKCLGMTQKQYFDWIKDENSLNKFYNTVHDERKVASKDK